MAGCWKRRRGISVDDERISELLDILSSEDDDSRSEDDVIFPKPLCLRNVIDSESDCESNGCASGSEIEKDSDIVINSSCSWDWKQDLKDPIIHKYTGHPGIRGDLGESVSRLGAFELFLNDEIVQHVVSETNRYGSADSDFDSITSNELKVYLALVILTLCGVPGEKDKKRVHMAV